MTTLLITEKGDIVKALNAFLAGLLRKGIVAAVMAPMRVSAGDAVFPALVADPDKLQADPFAPVLPVSEAQMVSRMTVDGPVSKPVAVVMRNCQIRALTELIKLKQAYADNLYIIGVDCAGTFALSDYKELTAQKDSGSLYKELIQGEKALTRKLRSACTTCVDPIPDSCDLVIGAYGVDLDKGLLLYPRTDRGKELLKGIDTGSGQDGTSREKAVNEVRKAHAAADEAFRQEHASVRGIDEVLALYSTCINCQNCRRVCPICYCQECFFVSDNLKQTGDGMIKKSRARGAFKMPVDTLLFHTGRMNHMILSCVECGLCEQACPSNIQLMKVLKRVAHDAQKKFEYKAGRNPEEEIPLMYYREDEFTEVGGKHD